MEPRARYVLVGSVIVLMTLLIVGAILWLSEVGALHHSTRYTIYFKEHALYGLQKDSDVTMRGIKVGSVAALQISPRNIEQVKVSLILNETTPVKADTEAIINRNLLTGWATIDLRGGTQDAPLLVEIPADEDSPVIPEGRSELEEIADSIPKLAEKAGELITPIRAVFSEQNVQSFTAVLSNLAAVTQSLADNRESLDTALKRFATLVDEVGTMTKRVDRFTQSTDRRLEAVSESFIDTLHELKRSATDLDKHTVETLQVVRSATQVISEDASRTLESVGEASRAATSAFQSFERPRTILTGPHEASLGPGERRR